MRIKMLLIIISLLVLSGCVTTKGKEVPISEEGIIMEETK